MADSKKGRIYLNGRLLSKIESDFLKELAKDYGVSVKEFIAALGDEKTIDEYLDNLEFGEVINVHTKHFIDSMDKQGFTFKIKGNDVTKQEIDAFLSKYYKGQYKKSLLKFDFNVNPIKKTVEIQNISQYNSGKMVYIK